MSPTYPGLSKTNYSELSCALALNYAQCSNYSEPGLPILNKSSQASLTLRNALLSPNLSGSTSFKGKSLIATMSSLASIPLPLTTNTLNPSEKLSLNSE